LFKKSTRERYVLLGTASWDQFAGESQSPLELEVHLLEAMPTAKLALKPAEASCVVRDRETEMPLVSVTL